MWPRFNPPWLHVHDGPDSPLPLSLPLTPSRPTHSSPQLCLTLSPLWSPRSASAKRVDLSLFFFIFPPSPLEPTSCHKFTWRTAANLSKYFLSPTFSLSHSTDLFKNNEVMLFLTVPDADVMNVRLLLKFFFFFGSHSTRGHEILRTDTCCLRFCSSSPHLNYSYLFDLATFFFLFHLERKGLTGCEFLIANSQDRISCNSNQGHLRWAYASFPPWPTALKAALCCGLPSPVTWLLWKCPLPPPPSLFPVNCLKGGGWLTLKPASL